MSYQWQWKPIGKEEQWQNLSSDASVQGTDSPTLTFSSSESCSEGRYRCTVTNCAGAVQSECVDHIIGELQHVHKQSALQDDEFNYRNSYNIASIKKYTYCFHVFVVTPHSFNAGKITDLPDLLNELSTVTQWFLFGIYLRVDLTTLSGIEADYQKAKERLTHTVIQWWRNVTPTWSAVVKALVGIRRGKLASQLAAKHGMNL